jgi:hypothetical protein
MHIALKWPRCLDSFAALAVVLAAGMGPAFAQSLGGKNQDEVPFRKVEQNFTKYLQGDMSASGPADKQAVETATAAAKYYVHKLTWFDIAGVSGSEAEYFAKHVKEFNRNMGYALESAAKDSAAKKPARNKAFVEIFSKQMVAALKELVGQSFTELNNQRSQIYAGVMLPALARLGSEDVGDYLVEILNDPKKHDALKVHALKGLAEFFAALPPRVDPDTVDEKVRARDRARVEAVLAFLERKSPVAENAPPEEVEAVGFVRREAVKALAATRLPALVVQKGKVEAPVALALLRVLAPEKNGLTPVSSLSERAEAAIGLCRIKPSVFEQYQPEAAICLVGKFLVDFAKKYKEDGESVLGKNKDKAPPFLAWKYHAQRLDQALKDLRAGVPAQAPYRQKLETMLSHASPLLDKIAKHRDIDDPALLGNALGQMWPSTPTLGVFQGVPDVQIQLPALKEG